MKLTKSILGPVRATGKGGGASFSFLSRRLRPSGGQASPFFSIIGKKRGGALDNHEPSSPKVTCIGQVRVKSKKKAKQCRRRIGEVSFRTAEQSQSHGGGGGVREIEDRDKVWIRRQRFSSSSLNSHRDQRWVHLPMSVCAALRTIRGEFCCFFPCRCSCFSMRKREKKRKSGCYPEENGCGAVLTRWLVAVNGGEGGKRREIEVVVGGDGDGGAAERVSFRSSRRHVFEDIEVKDDRIEVKGQSLVGEEEARVSICIPPKNALLLMRCRSDPMKMADLANRYSLEEHVAMKNGDNIEEEEDDDDEEENTDFDGVGGLFEGKHNVFVAEVDQMVGSVKLNEEEERENEVEESLEMEVGNNGDFEQLGEKELVIRNEENEERVEEKKEEFVEEEEEEEDIECKMSSFEDVLDREKTGHLCESAKTGEAAIQQVKTEEYIDTKTAQQHEEEEEAKKPASSTELEPAKSKSQESTISNIQEIKKEREIPALPECLLLMMCEPKLSMEVSKETWIRGADFIRLLPERPRKPAKTAVADGGDDGPVKRRPSVEYKSHRPRIPAAPTSKKNDQQPARSSCSLPAASTAAVIEQKQVKCEPFALTRCNSEPMSTAAAKLMPEPCFWKNSGGVKLEPHRQAATLDVGAAGAGF